MSIPLVEDEEEDEENVESEEGGEIFCAEELVMEIASCVRLPNMGSSLILTLIVNERKKWCVFWVVGWQKGLCQYQLYRSTDNQEDVRNKTFSLLDTS